MPITRREDEDRDPMDRHLLTVWNNKWVIIGVGILAGILTYCALLFVPESFTVKSELYVNNISPVTDGEPPSPETVVSLLKSQPVLEKTRNDYVSAFDIEPPPRIEQFVKQFKVKSSILQDTTVRKQYSPVLNLQVDSKGSSETRYIMERWISNFITDFGNYTTMEAVAKRDAFLAEKSRLETEISSVEALRSKYDAELPYLKRVLAEKLELLTPARLLFQDQDVDTIKLDFSVENRRMRPGLFERYSELQMDIEAGSAQSTAAQELAALSTAIKNAQSSITEAESALAGARNFQLKTLRHLQQLTANQTAVNEAVSRFTVAAAINKTYFEGKLPSAGDIRALSMPINPETRSWPKRTLTAGMVAIVASVLTILWLFSRNFLTRISASDPQ